MTANPDTIAPDDTIEHAAVLMIHGGYRHLPVVDGDNPVGVLSIHLVAVFLEDSAPRGASSGPGLSPRAAPPTARSDLLADPCDLPIRRSIMRWLPGTPDDPARSGGFVV